MKTESAEQNLELIRTLMERSAIYRRALAPMMLWTGGLALVAAFVGWGWRGMESHMGDRQFIGFWVVACAVALAGAMFLARRQAMRDREPFWSPPLRRVAQSVVPVGLVAAVWTAHVFQGAEAGLTDLPDKCVVVWSVLYGVALHAAGMFAPRTLRRAGWCFIGMGVFIGLFGGEINCSPNLWMGWVFGLLHLAGAGYLFATEKKHER